MSGRSSATAQLATGKVLCHRPTEAHQTAARRGVDVREERQHRGSRGGLRTREVEAAGFPAVSCHDEGPVVDLALGAEALGQATAPGTLLAGRLVVGAGHDVGRARRRPGSRRRREGGCRPGRPRRGRRAGPDGTGRASRPAETVSAREVRSKEATPIRSDGVPPMRSSVEKAKPRSFAALAGVGDEHPLLTLFREESDFEAGRPFGAQVGHLGQLGVGERRAVFGLDVDDMMPLPYSSVSGRRQPPAPVCRGGPRTVVPAARRYAGFHARSRPTILRDLYVPVEPACVEPAPCSGLRSAFGPSRLGAPRRGRRRLSTLNSDGQPQHLVADVEVAPASRRGARRASSLERRRRAR